MQLEQEKRGGAPEEDSEANQDAGARTVGWGLFRRIVGFFDDVRRMVSRTLFTKYLFVTSSVQICSLIVLGLIMATLVSSRWQTEKQQQLADNAHIVADGMNAYIVPVPSQNPKEGIEDAAIDYLITDAGKEKLRSTLGILSSSCGADIFIVDASGNTVICSEEYLHATTSEEETFLCRHMRATVAPSVIAAAARVPEYRVTDKLGGIYDKSHFIVAVPFVAGGETGNERIAGFVFVASSASAISEFRTDISRILAAAIIVAALVPLLWRHWSPSIWSIC